MLITTTIPRHFTFKNNGEEIKLDDPDHTWPADAVLNYYMPLYPILATATVQKPVLKDDALVIEFSPTIGTKG